MIYLFILKTTLSVQWDVCHFLLGSGLHQHKCPSPLNSVRNSRGGTWILCGDEPNTYCGCWKAPCPSWEKACFIPDLFISQNKEGRVKNQDRETIGLASCLFRILHPHVDLCCVCSMGCATFLELHQPIDANPTHLFALTIKLHFSETHVKRAGLFNHLGN